MKVYKKVISSTLALSVVLGGFAAGGTAINAQDLKPSFNGEASQVPEGLSKRDIALHYVNNAYNTSKMKSMKAAVKGSFEITDEVADKQTGTHHFRLDQLYNGIPIFGADQTLSLDENDNVTSYLGKVIPNLEEKNINTDSAISESEAISIAKNAIETQIGTVEEYDAESVKKYIYEHEGEFYFTYLVTASTSSPQVGFWHYFIDATNGNIVDSYNAAQEVTAFGTGVFGNRQMFEASFVDGVYTLHDQTRGKGVLTYDESKGRTLVTSNSKMFTDGAAVDAHANAQKTYDYFKKTFNRNSVDNNGQRLLSRVHVGTNWNNASWNGVYMSYGDGDGILFKSLAGGLDVAAHEMSHGVIQHSAGLIYRNESGALNESFADIFGAMVDRDDWVMGEDIMANGTIGLRSLKDPAELIERRTERPYPDHWDKRYLGNLDNGGVHINSSINNKAAFLISEGGEHYGTTVQGIGRKATEQILYRALTLYLTSGSGFAEMRQAAILAATDIYGSDSAEVNAVKAAYTSVGVN